MTGDTRNIKWFVETYEQLLNPNWIGTTETFKGWFITFNDGSEIELGFADMLRTERPEYSTVDCQGGEDRAEFQKIPAADNVILLRELTKKFGLTETDNKGPAVIIDESAVETKVRIK